MRDLSTSLGVAGFFLLFCSSIASLVFPEYRLYALFVGLLGLLGLGYFFLANREMVAQIFTGRSLKYGANAVALIGITFGIIVILNVLSVRHHVRFDTTELGFYSLSPQTMKFLQNLTQDVSVTAFFRKGRDDGVKRRFKELTNQYVYYTDRITFRFIDPDEDIAAARSFGIEEYGSIVFQVRDDDETGGSEEPSDEIRLQRGPRGDRRTINTEIVQPGGFNQPDLLLSNAAESEMTNTLITLTQTSRPLITFLVGHGERDVESNDPRGFSYIKKQLEDKSYQVDSLNLVIEGSIPDDVDVIAIASPQTDYLPDEIDVLTKFVSQGGSLFVLLDPQAPTSLKRLVLQYGVEVTDGIIIDSQVSLFGRIFTTSPFITRDGYLSHAITDGFDLNIQFPDATGLEEASDNNRTVEPLIITNEESWLETNYSPEMQTASLDESEDIRGPITLAMAVEQRFEQDGDGSGGENEASDARIVVFADSDFASNNFMGPATGNKDLFLNVISWLTEQEALIAISPKTAQARIIRLTPQQLSFIFWTGFIALPFSILLLGLSVWWRRRHL